MTENCVQDCWFWLPEHWVGSPDAHWAGMPGASMEPDLEASRLVVFASVSGSADSFPGGLQDAAFGLAAGLAKFLFANRPGFSFPNYYRFYDGYYPDDR